MLSVIWNKTTPFARASRRHRFRDLSSVTATCATHTRTITAVSWNLGASWRKCRSLRGAIHPSRHWRRCVSTVPITSTKMETTGVLTILARWRRVGGDKNASWCVGYAIYTLFPIFLCKLPEKIFRIDRSITAYTERLIYLGQGSKIVYVCACNYFQN